MPEYRTDGFKIVWLRYLMSKFDNHIVCGLYSKNIRGIKFLLNMGFENLKLNFNLEGVEAQLFGLKKVSKIMVFCLPLLKITILCQ